MSEPYVEDSPRAILGRHGELHTRTAIDIALGELGIVEECSVTLQSSLTEGLHPLERARRNQREGDYIVEYRGRRVHLESKSTQEYTAAETSSYPLHEFDEAASAGLIKLVVCHGMDQNYKLVWTYIRTFDSLELDRCFTRDEYFVFDKGKGHHLSLTERLRKALIT